MGEGAVRGHLPGVSSLLWVPVRELRLPDLSSKYKHQLRCLSTLAFLFNGLCLKLKFTNSSQTRTPPFFLRG